MNAGVTNERDARDAGASQRWVGGAMDGWAVNPGGGTPAGLSRAGSTFYFIYKPQHRNTVNVNVNKH